MLHFLFLFPLYLLSRVSLDFSAPSTDRPVPEPVTPSRMRLFPALLWSVYFSCRQVPLGHRLLCSHSTASSHSVVQMSASYQQNHLLKKLHSRESLTYHWSDLGNLPPIGSNRLDSSLCWKLVFSQKRSYLLEGAKVLRASKSMGSKSDCSDTMLPVPVLDCTKPLGMSNSWLDHLQICAFQPQMGCLTFGVSLFSPLLTDSNAMIVFPTCHALCLMLGSVEMFNSIKYLGDNFTNRL